MSGRQPTDRQMGALVTHVARIYLEVERGLRPPEHLKGLLARRTYEDLRRAPLETRHPQAGPVTPGDIGRAFIDRNLPRQVTASIPARESGQRWGAISVHLRQGRDGWVVDRVERLSRRGLEAQPDNESREREDLASRIRLAESERRAVTSAQIAVDRRLREVVEKGASPPAGSTESDLRDQANRWATRVEELDRELQSLRSRQQLARHDDDRTGPSAMDDVVTRRLSGIIGPRPDAPQGRKLWDDAHNKISRYREVWDVTDEDSLLGPEPEYEGQSRHRARVADSIRVIAARLRHPSLREPRPPREAERSLSFGR